MTGVQLQTQPLCFLFWPHHTARGMLPRPVTKPSPPAQGARSLNHWTWGRSQTQLLDERRSTTCHITDAEHSWMERESELYFVTYHRELQNMCIKGPQAVTIDNHCCKQHFLQFTPHLGPPQRTHTLSTRFLTQTKKEFSVSLEEPHLLR